MSKATLFEVKADLKDAAVITGRFAGAGSSAPTLPISNPPGWTVVRSSAGIYRISFAENYSALISGMAMLGGTTPANLKGHTMVWDDYVAASGNTNAYREVSVYKPATSAGDAATGVITCVTKANFADSDYMTIFDGVNPGVLFEFDKTGDGVTDSTAYKAVKAAGTMQLVAKASFADSDYCTIGDGSSIPVIYEFDATGDNVTDGTSSTAVQASIIITCTTKANYIDHEDMLQLVDEFGDTQELYEADPAGDGVPSGIAVNINGATTAIDVAAILGPLIVTNSPWLTVVVVGDGTLTLTHKQYGAFGNLLAPTENVANGAHIVPAAFTGGLDAGGPEVRRVQVDISGATTDADCAAIMKTAMNIWQPNITVVDPVDGTLTFTHDTPGSAANITITENVSNGTFAVTGMSGGLDAGGPLDRRVLVDISGATTAAQCAAILDTAITANMPLITVVDPVDGTLTLTHDQLGTAGNATITENVTNAGFLVSGMSGGVEVTDTDALHDLVATEFLEFWMTFQRTSVRR